MDKYDRAMKYLEVAMREWRDEDCDGDSDSPIYAAWGDPTDDDEIGGCLFAYAGPDDKQYVDGVAIGCLTQLRSHNQHTGGIVRFVAATPELTELIRADKRIPCNPNDITLEDLPVFAEWQRKIDRLFGRED